MKIKAPEFRAVTVGDITILFRPAKAASVADSLGNPGKIVVAGGLIMRPQKKGAFSFAPGTVHFEAAKATWADLRTSGHQSAWMGAGAIIGERFMSVDIQKIGGETIGVFRRKRTDDFTHICNLWSAWRKWREAGSLQTFEVFHFGTLKKITACISTSRSAALSAAAEAEDAYLRESRAAVQALAEIGLSVARKIKPRSVI